MLTETLRHIPHTSNAADLPSTEDRDTAQYVAELILELRNLAKAHMFHELTTSLEFSYYEAFSVANKVAIPDSELAFLKKLENAAEHGVRGKEHVASITR